MTKIERACVSLCIESCQRFKLITFKESAIIIISCICITFGFLFHIFKIKAFHMLNVGKEEVAWTKNSNLWSGWNVESKISGL